MSKKMAETVEKEQTNYDEALATLQAETQEFQDKKEKLETELITLQVGCKCILVFHSSCISYDPLSHQRVLFNFGSILILEDTQVLVCIRNDLQIPVGSMCGRLGIDSPDRGNLIMAAKKGY